MIPGVALGRFKVGIHTLTHADLPGDKSSNSNPTVHRVSCVSQIQILKAPSDIQEMEQQIKDLLQGPYDNGSITIVTEDIQIRRICE